MDEVEIKIMEINPRKIRKILKEKAKFVKRVSKGITFTQTRL